jgi:hypothetical protein
MAALPAVGPAASRPQARQRQLTVGLPAHRIRLARAGSLALDHLSHFGSVCSHPSRGRLRPQARLPMRQLLAPSNGVLLSVPGRGSFRTMVADELPSVLDARAEAAHDATQYGPIMPLTSRFPLSPSGGQLTPSSALPSGPVTRPFGRRYAVRPVECGTARSLRTGSGPSPPRSPTMAGGRCQAPASPSPARRHIMPSR